MARGHQIPGNVGNERGMSNETLISITQDDHQNVTNLINIPQVNVPDPPIAPDVDMALEEPEMIQIPNQDVVEAQPQPMI